MAIVKNGEIRSLSVSRVETFVACQVQWWLEAVKGFQRPDTASKKEGNAGHALLAGYLRSGEPPEGRVLMGKAVRAAIARAASPETGPALPTPGPDMQVETRFDGGNAQYDANGKWIPFDAQRTFWLGGLPWDGFIDLRYRRGDAVTVLDHKFSADPDKYAVAQDKLIETVQLPVYCLDSLRQWPDATSFEIGHHNVKRSGERSFIRRALVTLDQVRDREADVVQTVERMKQFARAERQEDVPFNRKACEAYGGCPHQSRCKAFKGERRMMNELPPELLSLFGGAFGASPSAPAPIKGHPDYPDAPTAAPTDVSPGPYCTAWVQEGGRYVSCAELNGHQGDHQYARATGVAQPAVPEPEATPVAAATEGATCGDCGAAVNRDNGARMPDGVWQHVGCPAKAPPAPTEKPKRERKPKAAAPDLAAVVADIKAVAEARETVAPEQRPAFAHPAPGPAVLGLATGGIAPPPPPAPPASPAPSATVITIRFELGLDPRLLELIAKAVGR